MIYQDGISFVEDADQVEFFPYGTTDDYAAIQSMAGPTKDQEFQAFNLGEYHESGIDMVLTFCSV